MSRHYDAQQGRFTQVDPLGMGAVSLGNPQSMNLYTYCGNDPLNRLDPSGLFFGFLKSLFGFIVKVVGVINKIIAFVAVAVLVVAAVLAVVVAPEAAWLFLYHVGGLLEQLGLFHSAPLVYSFASAAPPAIGATSYILAGVEAVGAVNMFFQVQRHMTAGTSKSDQRRGGDKLSPCVKKTLSKYFDEGLLNAVRLYNHSQVPRDLGMGAVTYHDNIYVSGSYSQHTANGISKIGHEIVHAQQYRDYPLFLGQYILNTAVPLVVPFGLPLALDRLRGGSWGHDHQLFERPAIQVERKIFADLKNSTPCPK